MLGGREVTAARAALRLDSLGLKPGDVVEASIDGIGTLRNEISPDAAP